MNRHKFGCKFGDFFFAMVLESTTAECFPQGVFLIATILWPQVFLHIIYCTCLCVSFPGIYNSYKIYERKSLRVWVLALKLGKQVETNLANIGSRGEVEREKQHLLEAHRKATNLLCCESM